MKDERYKKQRREMMNPVNAYTSEDAYAKQLSPYVIQGEGGQYYGLSCFVNHVEGKVYPDRPPDEARLAKEKLPLGTTVSCSCQTLLAIIKKASNFQLASEKMDL